LLPSFFVFFFKKFPNLSCDNPINKEEEEKILNKKQKQKNNKNNNNNNNNNNKQINK